MPDPSFMPIKGERRKSRFPAHDLDHARRDVADGGQHVILGHVLGAHGVFAGDDLGVRAERLVDSLCHDRIRLQHRKAGTVGHDFDIGVGLSQIGLDIPDVIEGEFPFFWVIVAHLENDLVAHGRLGRFGSIVGRMGLQAEAG
jgi:hypothetical protein